MLTPQQHMAFSINVFMLHLAALLSGVKHCRFRFFSHKIPGAAGGWEVKEKVNLLKLFKLCSLHAYAEDSRVPLLTAAPLLEMHHFSTPRLLDQSQQERRGK